MSCALRVKTATQQTHRPFIPGGVRQQNGAGGSPPLRLLLRGRAAGCLFPPQKQTALAGRLVLLGAVAVSVHRIFQRTGRAEFPALVAGLGCPEFWHTGGGNPYRRAGLRVAPIAGGALAHVETAEAVQCSHVAISQRHFHGAFECVYGPLGCAF